MPYRTSQGGYADAANSIAKLFVGDPVADAEARNQQIKNETEYRRQRLLSEQAISEETRRQQMAAAAAANQALAAERQQGVDARNDLGQLFTQDFRTFDEPGGMSVPGDAPAGTPGAGFSIDAQGPQILQHIMTGDIDPKQLSAVALMPGVDDADLGRLMVGAGNFIGKDDYVSIDDRNTNRNYELGGNERLVGGDGAVKLGLDPTQETANTALANQRNAAAENYRARAAGGGGKVPKLDQREMNRFMREALMARGAPMVVDDTYVSPADYLQGQPDIYSNLARLIDQSYATSGGRASAVQDAIGLYLQGADFTNFRTPAGHGIFDGPPRFEYAPIEGLPDIQSIIDQLQPGYIEPEIFTEGGTEDLQSRQNVGNASGQWKILGVR